MKEVDLYPPLKTYLESQHYEVKGEVHDCDVMALRGKEQPVIVELKLTLNLTVLLQAVSRLVLSPLVYIGIPRHCTVLKKQRKHIIKLLRMLGLGLLVIDVNGKKQTVKVIVDPGEYKPRPSSYRQQRLLGEFAKRVGDPNAGGAEMKGGIMTSYRQRALAIAAFLEKHGPCKAAHIAEQTKDIKSRAILYRDVYGWFERVDRGIYALSPRGLKEIPQWLQNRD